MKKIYLVGLAAVGMLFTAQAQDCSEGRYRLPVFDNFNLTSDVQYGSNDDRQGNNVDLLLDIYEPEGDTESERPLIIFAHGGTFIAGSKTGDDVVPMAQEFAKKGYVTASINYRLGMDNLLTPTGPSEGDASEAVFRATQDLKAAIRFFRKSIEEDGNPYKLDTDNFFVVGSSAGGFMAVHHAYLDEESEIPESIDFSKPGLTGGIEGESGNPGFSTELKAIANLAGALGDVEWMSADDTPVISLHGDEDGTVPYATDMISVAIFEIIEVSGSFSIHQKADEIGLQNCFKPFFGQDHVPHVSNAAYLDTTINYVTNFFLHFVCDQAEYCFYDETLSVNEVEKPNFTMYPNPASSSFKIISDQPIEAYSIIGLNGQVVATKEQLLDQEITVDSYDYPSGMYLVQIRTAQGISTNKLIIE